MSTFGKVSLSRIVTIDERLQDVLNEVIKHYDFSVICGHRTKEDQEKAYSQGFSKAKWGQSKHNVYPSLAVDLAPYPIDWNDTERFHYLAGLIIATGKAKGIDILWGGDFKSITDLPHFELRT